MICSRGGFSARMPFPHLVAADAAIGLERPRPLVAAAARMHVRFIGRRPCSRCVAHYSAHPGSASTFSAVRCSWNTWSTIIIGAPVQAARHSSSRLRKMRPSGVLSSRRMPSLLLGVRHQLLAAAQHAGDVGADADVMAPAGMGLEHRVEARDLVHLDRRQLQVLGDRVHELGREVAVVLLLRRAQRRDARRALPPGRELRHPVVDLARASRPPAACSLLSARVRRG